MYLFFFKNLSAISNSARFYEDERHFGAHAHFLPYDAVLICERSERCNVLVFCFVVVFIRLGNATAIPNHSTIVNFVNNMNTVLICVCQAMDRER